MMSNTIHLSKKTVTAAFREEIADLLPLGENLAYWRMTEHLMFGAWRDEETHELFLPAKLIAAIEGKKHNGAYCAWDFLQEYSQNVAELDLRPSTWVDCRRLESVDWPEGVEELVQAERRITGGEKVLMVTGSKYRREHEIADRKQTQAEALELMSNAGCQVAHGLLCYLNTLAPNRFSAIKKHLAAAHSVADTLEKDREHQHNLLQAIESQAQPFYAPGGMSTRIFSMNESLLRLQRGVRKTLTQDWVTADLTSAQLAIVSKVWDLPELTELLQNKYDIWGEMCAWWGLDFNESNKQICKDSLYAIIFGAGKNRMVRALSEHFASGASAYKRIQKHPVINLLLAARTQQFKEIKQAGGAFDAFGRWYDLRYFAVRDQYFDYDNTRSILALIAQSFELALLSPIVEMAVADAGENVSICTWLHDGYTFDVRDKRRIPLWKEKMSFAVQMQAESLGIFTKLHFT